MYAIMTGLNGNTRIIYEYICDTESDIESLPTDKAPDATKTLYSAESKPVISGALTLKAIGILTGYANSNVLEAAYTIV